MIKRVKYFAYGSNLSVEQMEERGVEIFDTETAVLPGWRLAFTLYSDNWGGGVSDIIPGREENRVEGVIYTIHRDGLKALDGYENRIIAAEREVGTYRRHYLPVKTENGWRTVVTYVVNRPLESKEPFQYSPSIEYVNTIIKGAEYHGLDEEYITDLENIIKMISFVGEDIQ